MAHKKYKRVLLKLSGEAMAGNQRYGIDTVSYTHLQRFLDNIFKKAVYNLK